MVLKPRLPASTIMKWPELTGTGFQPCFSQNAAIFSDEARSASTFLATSDLNVALSLIRWEMSASPIDPTDVSCSRGTGIGDTREARALTLRNEADVQQPADHEWVVLADDHAETEPVAPEATVSTPQGSAYSLLKL
jgi:hypothetical protein